MGILDGIVEWIAEQVMNGLDLVTTSVLGALGCDMAVFLRYFPAAETMYKVFVALAIGIILINWVWQLFKNFGLGVGIEAEAPVRLSIRSILFILLAYFSDGDGMEIINPYETSPVYNANLFVSQITGRLHRCFTSFPANAPIITEYNENSNERTDCYICNLVQPF